MNYGYSVADVDLLLWLYMMYLGLSKLTSLMMC